jgi:hypothetical protein
MVSHFNKTFLFFDINHETSPPVPSSPTSSTLPTLPISPHHHHHCTGKQAVQRATT